MSHIHHLEDIILLLGALVVVVLVFRELKLSPVLGYLIVGAALGPHGFSIIEDPYRRRNPPKDTSLQQEQQKGIFRICYWHLQNSG